jgi:Transposase IS116/IS110/IS902 family
MEGTSPSRTNRDAATGNEVPRWEVRTLINSLGRGGPWLFCTLASISPRTSLPSTGWCGIVPRQHSSGGKNQLGRITRRGDSYLRTLLIQGAKSAVLTAHKRQDPISRWALRLRERSGWQVAAVALANKNARILWAVMTKGERFDARHVSVRPGAPVPATA